LKNEFFKSNGFYVALYSLVGILVVLGIGIGLKNYSGNENKTISQAKSDVSFPNEESTGVNRQFDPPTNFYETDAPLSSYIDPHESADLLAEALENFTSEQTKKVDIPEISAEDIAPGIINETNEKPIEKAYVPLEKPSAEENEVAQVSNGLDEAATEKSFESFVDGNKMSWPLIGQIVMDYSTDHVVYDKTLELYRTNNSLWISGELGDQIKATADGVVLKVTKDYEYGNTVIIDNGNGWTTTYGQLQDNILVTEGDVVTTGQVIGGVNKPTKNASAEGTHLFLQICKNNETIDPKLLLAQ